MNHARRGTDDSIETKLFERLRTTTFIAFAATVWLILTGLYGVPGSLIAFTVAIWSAAVVIFFYYLGFDGGVAEGRWRERQR